MLKLKEGTQIRLKSNQQDEC